MVMPAIFLLVMAWAFPVDAAIIVRIGDAADKDALFWVETKSSHSLIHGSYINTIDERFMHPGETAEISVVALNPLTFSFVYASIYHPAYIYDSKRVREMPSVFKTVTIPKFEPRSWREFIDSGEKVMHSGRGIHLENVVDHFKLFIKPYLPTIDNAGIGNNITDYISLFEQLVSHTEKTLPHSTYGMKSIEDRRQQDQAYARRLDQTEQGRLKELKDLFLEIKALLSISAEERIRFRSLQSKLINAQSVYHELMTARDRQSIEEFLDFQFKNSRSRPRPKNTQQWVGSGTSILYSITLGDRYSLNDNNGMRLYEACYRTGLSVDLYGGEKTNLKNTQKSLNANFCRNEKEEWVIQLPGN
jgi:hypothetical protein